MYHIDQFIISSSNFKIDVFEPSVNRIISKFYQLNPATKVDIIDTKWDRCSQAIINHSTDISITTGTSLLHEIQIKLIFSDSFYLI